MTGHVPAMIVGALHGLREWRVDSGSTTLRGAVFDDASRWEPHGEATSAACRTLSPGGSAHEPPAHGCECGLHAFHPDRATAHRAFGAAQMGKVVGIVEAWGRVEVHIDGFRAQFARPHALLRAPGREACAEIEEIATHHDAQVLRVRDGEELYRNCRRHRFGIAEHVLEETFGTAYWRALLRDLTYWSGPPTWPPNMNAATRCSMDLTPGDLHGEFRRQGQEAPRSAAAARAWLAEKGVTTATRQFTFLLDRDGTLCRWDESYASDVWWPPKHGKPGQWHGYPMNPFTANVTAISPERAQELAGPGADLYADAPHRLPRPPGSRRWPTEQAPLASRASRASVSGGPDLVPPET